MDGFFLENGPFKVKEDMTLELNPHSWHKVRPAWWRLGDCCASMRSDACAQHHTIGLRAPLYPSSASSSTY
jgi:hypothetical protein